MVPLPSRSASLPIDNAPRPSASANSMAAATMRSLVRPRDRRAGTPCPQSSSSARGSGASSWFGGPDGLVITVQPKRVRLRCVPYTLMRMAYAPGSVAAKWLAPALAVVVAAFLVISLPPYFTGDPARSRVPATFFLHYPLLVGHVMFASVAIVTAVAQIWP